MHPEKSVLLSSFRQTLALEARGIEETSISMDLSICDGLELLLECKGRVIVTGMGKSGHIGRKIAATLSSTGTPSQFVHPAEAGHGDLGMITAQDVILALSNSGETAELMPILAHAKRFSIPLLAIVTGRDNNLAQSADYVFALPPLEEACPLGLAPTTSSTVMLALGDAIALTLLECKGFSKDDFANIHPAGKLGAQLLRVSDLMHRENEIPLISLNKKMDEALIVMTKKHFGCLGVINDKNQLQGIITDGDLRRHMNKDLLHKKTQDIMTANPMMVTQERLASQALAIMNDNKITVLFVKKDEHSKEVQGILHIHDCLRAGIR